MVGNLICGKNKQFQISHCIASHLSENKVVWQEVEDCEERVQSNLRGYLRWEPLLHLLSLTLLT